MIFYVFLSQHFVIAIDTLYHPMFGAGGRRHPRGVSSGRRWGPGLQQDVLNNITQSETPSEWISIISGSQYYAAKGLNPAKFLACLGCEKSEVSCIYRTQVSLVRSMGLVVSH